MRIWGHFFRHALSYSHAPSTVQLQVAGLSSLHACLSLRTTRPCITPVPLGRSQLIALLSAYHLLDSLSPPLSSSFFFHPPLLPSEAITASHLSPSLIANASSIVPTISGRSRMNRRKHSLSIDREEPECEMRLYLVQVLGRLCLRCACVSGMGFFPFP